MSDLADPESSNAQNGRWFISHRNLGLDRNLLGLYSYFKSCCCIAIKISSSWLTIRSSFFRVDCSFGGKNFNRSFFTSSYDRLLNYYDFGAKSSWESVEENLYQVIIG